MVQYLATQSSCSRPFEALETQAIILTRSGCIFDLFSSMIRDGYACVADTLRLRQTGLFGPVGFIKSDWRNRCQRASNSWQWSPLLAPLQPVTTLRKKSSLSSFLSRFRLSRRTPANTNKNSSGLAVRLVPSAFCAALPRPQQEACSC